MNNVVDAYNNQHVCYASTIHTLTPSTPYTGILDGLSWLRKVPSVTPTPEALTYNWPPPLPPIPPLPLFLLRKTAAFWISDDR